MLSACGLLHLVQFLSIAALDGVFFVLREPYPTWHATGLAPSANSLTPHQFFNPQSSNQANFTFQTTMGLPTSTQSEGSAAKLGVGAFGAFALGAAALL